MEPGRPVRWRCPDAPSGAGYDPGVLPYLLLTDDATPTVALVPLGRVNAREVAAVRRALVQTYGLEVVVAPRRALPRETYYPPRNRYRAEHLIAWLAKVDLPAFKVLGVTDRDISTTAHGRKDWGIAGQAQLSGRGAVVSSFRAKGQLGEVAVHEIGHTLGLPHCPHSGCVMQDARGKISHIGTHFCPECAAKIARWLP